MHKGFTLIEMMVAVAIIGILAAIALPSYQDSVRKSRRSDAIVMFSKIQLAEEKWRANNISYTNILGTDGLNLTSGANTATIKTESGFYDVVVSGASGSAYIITATADRAKSQSKDSGCTPLIMTINNGNATGTPIACWQK